MSRPILSLVTSASAPASPAPERLEWPETPKPFGLSRLVEISRVDAPTIKRWNHRGAIRFRRVPIGKVRHYHLTDALDLAVIAEMARLGFPITGKGALLTEAVAGKIDYAVSDDRDVSRLKPIAFVPIEGADDYEVHDDIAAAAEAGTHIVVDLKRITEGVVQRYRATI